MRTLRDAIHQWLDQVDDRSIKLINARGKFAGPDGRFVQAQALREPEAALRHIAETRQLANTFLDSRAFGRILAEMDESAKSVEAALELLVFLKWVNIEWRRIHSSPSAVLEQPPGVLWIFEKQADAIDEAAALVTKARDLMPEKLRRNADRLLKQLSKYKTGPEQTYLFDPVHMAKRGAAKDPIKAFRGAVARQLDKRLPKSLDMRAAAITALLKLAGDMAVTRQSVQILLNAKGRNV